jgi:hypothetical protein
MRREGNIMMLKLESDLCDHCGRPTYDWPTCRNCRKREEGNRRTLRLVRERRRARGWGYGRI